MKAELEQAAARREEKILKKKKTQLNAATKLLGLPKTKRTNLFRKKDSVNPKRNVKKGPTKKLTKKLSKRKLSFESSSDEDIDMKNICDDNEDDDAFDIFSKEVEVCIVCGEFGLTELWFRCTICGKWAHSECSGADSAENYICDFCT